MASRIVFIAASVALIIGVVQHASAATESISTVQRLAAERLSNAAIVPMGKLVIPVTYTEEFPQQIPIKLPKGIEFAGGTGRS